MILKQYKNDIIHLCIRNLQRADVSWIVEMFTQCVWNRC